MDCGPWICPIGAHGSLFEYRGIGKNRCKRILLTIQCKVSVGSRSGLKTRTPGSPYLHWPLRSGWSLRPKRSHRRMWSSACWGSQLSRLHAFSDCQRCRSQTKPLTRVDRLHDEMSIDKNSALKCRLISFDELIIQLLIGRVRVIDRT
jgi:hypothetical protein